MSTLTVTNDGHHYEPGANPDHIEVLNFDIVVPDPLEASRYGLSDRDSQECLRGVLQLPLLQSVRTITVTGNFFNGQLFFMWGNEGEERPHRLGDASVDYTVHVYIRHPVVCIQDMGLNNPSVNDDTIALKITFDTPDEDATCHVFKLLCDTHIVSANVLSAGSGKKETLWLEDQAFSGCSRLREFKWDSNVHLQMSETHDPFEGAMGRQFEDCYALETVLMTGIPTAHTFKIPHQAFSGCESLKNTNFTRNIETMGINAFQDAGLTAFHGGDSLDSFFIDRFTGAHNLTVVDLSNCSSLDTVITVPNENSWGQAAPLAFFMPERCLQLLAPFRPLAGTSFVECDRGDEYMGPPVMLVLPPNSRPERHLTVWFSILFQLNRTPLVMHRSRRVFDTFVNEVFVPVMTKDGYPAHELKEAARRVRQTFVRTDLYRNTFLMKFRLGKSSLPDLPLDERRRMAAVALSAGRRGRAGKVSSVPDLPESVLTHISRYGDDVHQTNARFDDHTAGNKTDLF